MQQYLQPQNISQNQLARAIKVPPRRINEIVHEKRGISADTAVRLAVYFNGSAMYWLHLQSEFEVGKIKDRIKIQLGSVQAQAPLKPTISNIKRPTSKPNTNVKKRIMR